VKDSIAKTGKVNKLPLMSAYLLVVLTVAINGGNATGQPKSDRTSTTAPSSQHPSNTYPNEVVKRYVDSCVGNGMSVAICTCTVRELQKTYSLQEFEKLGSNLQTGGAVPDNLTAIAMTCLSGSGN